MTLTLASQIIGFVSFSITLLTLLGVYSDLIKTLRGAPSTIPLSLSNLREEIQFEQLYLKAKLRRGDEYQCFPDTSLQRRRRRRDFAALMDETLRHLWTEFCDLERPFLIRGGTPWTLQGLDETDIGSGLEEKEDATRRRRTNNRLPRRESYMKNRMGMIEAGLSMDKGTYYNTDFAHRFYWWWKADDIKNIADQIQRLQIRRMERDILEADEIIKRFYHKQCRASNWDWRRSDDSDDSQNSGRESNDSGADRGTRGHSDRRASRNGMQNARRTSKRRTKRPSERDTMETYERELVRPVRRPDEVVRKYAKSSGDASKAARSPGTYEYEVINPGSIYIEEVRAERPRSPSRRSSYSRERY